MNKTILFPVDFTVESLNLVKKAIEDHPGEKLDLVLIHGIHSSDSITDLLFFSKGKIIQKLTNPAFDGACELLGNLYKDQINSLKTELFTGFTQSAFNGFLEDLNIDKIYCPASLNVTLNNKMSADLTRFLLKSKIEKIVVPVDSETRGVNTHKVTSQISIAK